MIESTQAIHIKYINPTASNGTRIKLIDKRYNSTRTLSFDYDIGNVLTQAQRWLEDEGYTLHNCGTWADDWFITVTYGDSFKDIQHAGR